jgi:hypothetical protein
LHASLQLVALRWAAFLHTRRVSQSAILCHEVPYCAKVPPRATGSSYAS